MLEIRALLAFLPRICQALRGEPLILPNIATWWCGQPAERAHVRAAKQRMMIGPALSTRLPFETDETTVLGSRVRSQERFDAWLEADGAALVGQEAVTLSTTPAYVDGRLLPRPMSLRVFLARTASGWTVMPGGFARIGSSADPTAIAMQRGGTAADVWVVSETPVESDTMLPGPSVPYARIRPGVLPEPLRRQPLLARPLRGARPRGRCGRCGPTTCGWRRPPTTDAPLLAYLSYYLDTLGVDTAEPVPSPADRHARRSSAPATCATASRPTAGTR